MLGMTGFRLVNAPTFVPAYLHSISGSDVWVGIGTSLQQLGGIVSPIIGAQQIEHRKKHPAGVGDARPADAGADTGAGGVGLVPGGRPALVLALLFLFLLGFFQGPQRVAFQLLLAKVIPIRLRGRLQAWRNLTGGLIAAVLSYFAGSWLVANHVFGQWLCDDVLPRFRADQPRPFGAADADAGARAADGTGANELSGADEGLPGADRRGQGLCLVHGGAVASRWAPASASPSSSSMRRRVLGISAESDPVEFGSTLAVLSFAYMGADTVTQPAVGLSRRTGRGSARPS